MKSTFRRLETNQKRPMSVTAYERICRKIITLEYAPGLVLEEKQVMADLGLGRTPVREALLRLAGEGWIESLPNKGVMVPPITLQGTKAVFEAMKILETGIVSLAVNQDISELLEQIRAASALVRVTAENGDVLGLVDANDSFHLWFAACCKNEYLIRAATEVRNHAKRLAYLSFTSQTDPQRSLRLHYESVVNEHFDIITFLEERDETKLRHIVLQHIGAFQQRILKYLTC